MRPIARQSTRLATISTSKQCATPNKRHCEQHRAFNTSVRRRQEPRPPNGWADSPAPASELREHDNKTAHGVGRQEQSAEQANAERRTASDAWTHSRKRKAAQDIPKPPPIPDWFLRQNVTLYKTSPEDDVRTDVGQVIHCVDIATGHTLFTVPHYEAWPHLPEKGSDSKRSEKVENDSAAANEAIRESERHPPLHDTKKTRQAFSALFEMQVQREIELDPGRWTFLELEAILRAALSLGNQSETSTSSFARDRVDLSLQSVGPDLGYEQTKYVRDLARIVQADLIRLDVNDLAELSQDYVGHGLDEPGTISTLGYDVYEGYEAPDFGAPQPQSKAREEEEAEEEDDVEDDKSPKLPGSNLVLFGGAIDLRKLLQIGGNPLGNVEIGQGGQRSPPDAMRSRIAPTSDSNRTEERLSALLEQLLDAPKHKRTTKDDIAVASDVQRPTEPLLESKSEKQLVQDVGIGTQDPPASRPKSAQEASSEHQLDQKRMDFDTVADDSMEFQLAPGSWDRVERVLPTTADRELWTSHVSRRRSSPSIWFPRVAGSLATYVAAAAESGLAKKEVKLTSQPPSLPTESSAANIPPKTIVHVRDLRDICETQLGNQIVHRLVELVRKRRRNGQEIVIVGTTAQDAPGPVKTAGDHVDTFPFLALNVPPFFNFTEADYRDFRALPASTTPHSSSARILEINLRHIQSMVRRIRPEAKIQWLPKSVHAERDTVPSVPSLPDMYNLTKKVLSMDQVQRLALVAIGLLQSHVPGGEIHPIHISMANFITTRADAVATQFSEFVEERQTKLSGTNERNSPPIRAIKREESSEAKVDRLKKICNPHETRLLSGMVDPQNIKTAFTDVHAPTETIDAVKTLTTLSLLRPEAFTYGVLANDRLPGLLLYGPPGTGKTLLAKAVAKESNATVLEVSGAQIYEKYVGEGEKMVQAVFSLAKKLSPCVVFIDEADAIFGGRGHSANRTSHRQIINQFLRELDGMDDHSVFMMVATNRPFDLDDAVLRRLPRRLLVDLPVVKDRESILGIHLKHETLDSSVSLNQLAEETPLYSGSDLKNLAVAAALACVREENELAAANREDKDFKLPEKRTLTPKHFEKALTEISASISEDMSSLIAIRKFDERYGDRKGRRKKNAWGFGDAEGTDERSARVR